VLDKQELNLLLLKSQGEFIQRQIFVLDNDFKKNKDQNNNNMFKYEGSKCEKFLWAHKQTLKSIHAGDCDSPIVFLSYEFSHLNITPLGVYFSVSDNEFFSVKYDNYDISDGIIMLNVISRNIHNLKALNLDGLLHIDSVVIFTVYCADYM